MSPANGSIFINYRKDDSSWSTLALYNELLKYFRKDQLFKDFHTIQPGDDFEESIKNALLQCDVLLVVIGKTWTDIRDRNGNRRLEDPNDFVRIEIATALERKIQVIPILYDTASMPGKHELPENIRPLCTRQFTEIDPKRFEDDVRKLADTISDVLSRQGARISSGLQDRPKKRIEKPAKPPTYLILGIITLIACCLPFGILSLIAGSKVDNYYAAGRYEEAVAASRKAKNMGVYAIVAGAIFYIILIIIGANAK